MNMDFLKEHAPLLAKYSKYWPYLIFLACVVVVVNLISKYKGGTKKPSNRDIQETNSEDASYVFQETIGRANTDNTEADDSYLEEDQDFPHVNYKGVRYPADVMIKRSASFYEDMNKRRSVRFFKPDPVPLEVIQNVIKTAGNTSIA